ncbi:ABC transporter permease [Solwaraspora sp. WMMD1047]|uniref:FtsX-like permease family protein n=1 Tax=Solwaraspora sp. WMMD1047 TaxID=3016102 RepID=UPI002415FBD0|nr:FtsX-like permease family protein [Solwaraspora sp. WMMD1047]MDG4827889.1 ABC transporter permease [Solwaraspora sp. WMMD1047]
MKITTLVRLALAGTRTDTLRVLLTGFSAALAALVLLAAFTVLAIPTPPLDPENWTANHSTHYTFNLLIEPGLRPGLAITLLLFSIPVLALAGQCARLGAPARDRRLAAIRLAGATPGQAVAVAATETGLASLLGAAAGLGAYLLGRQLLHRPTADGRLPLPTDVLPAPPVLVAVVLGLPLVAGLAAALLLRRVALTPAGVVRRVRRTGSPGWWPGLLIAIGLGTFAGLEPALRWLGERGASVPGALLALILLVGGLVAMIGVVLGTGWISYTAGRILHRYARRPATLLAARRLTDDPWSGSRVFAALLACVVFGAGAIAARAHFVTSNRADAQRQRMSEIADGVAPGTYAWSNPFYLQTIDLIDVAVLVALVIAAGGLVVMLAEQIVSRRWTYASLVATGVPRGVIGRAILWQAVTPMLPAILVALAVGSALSRGYLGDVQSGGGSTEFCDADAAVCADPVARQPYLRIVEDPVVWHAVDLAIGRLAVFGAGAFGAVLVTVAIGLLFLRPSTAVEELRVA